MVSAMHKAPKLQEERAGGCERHTYEVKVSLPKQMKLYRDLPPLQERVLCYDTDIGWIRVGKLSGTVDWSWRVTTFRNLLWPIRKVMPFKLEIKGVAHKSHYSDCLRNVVRRLTLTLTVSNSWWWRCSKDRGGRGDSSSLPPNDL